MVEKRVLMVLAYDITADSEEEYQYVLKALERCYSYFQGRTETISGVGHHVKCVDRIPTIIDPGAAHPVMECEVCVGVPTLRVCPKCGVKP